MRTKLIVSMGAVGLAAWMGASFVAPAEVAEGPPLAEGPDSHRLGVLVAEDVGLPERSVAVDGPNLFCFLTRED